MKILIVEDDRNYRALLYQALHMEEHDVLAVSDAVHAVALLDENDHGIDIVILDLNMPRLGGGEVMETFAGWTKCRTRFIVMSGILNPDRYDNHPKVVGSLHKPFSTDDLSKLLKKAEVLLAKDKQSPMPAAPDSQAQSRIKPAPRR